MSRRGLLATGGAALAAVLAACRSSPAPAPDRATSANLPPERRERYGTGSQQFGDLYLPADGETVRGTVVVIHGGFWRSGYALDLGAATSVDLAARGFVAWNIEYRRLGNGGGWPATFEDVAAAVDHLDTLDLPAGARDHVVPLGHSAGGHLAAWVASRDRSTPGGAPRVQATAVVPQAAVLDLRTAARQGLGGSVVAELMGGRPDVVPEHYALGDPLERLPVGVPVRCVHGSADQVVPLSQSRTYVEAATRAGDDAELVEVPGDHFALIDPSTPAWKRILEVLTELTG